MVMKGVRESGAASRIFGRNLNEVTLSKCQPGHAFKETIYFCEIFVNFVYDGLKSFLLFL